jgi:DNA polymerase V
MYALVDCNNFYCSCERVFNPKLEGRPVVVLSNNDGCAIARNEEAKKLGIVMGTPGFMLQNDIKKYNIAVFSSNYILYGDMSDRVMKTLARLCSRMEIYSIDEAYLDVHDMPYHDLLGLGMNMRNTVKRNTGIPVSVGIAPTKTLAKMANRYTKKKYKDIGVFSAANAALIQEMLENTAVEDICGIGHAYAKFLQGHGFTTAADFAKAPDEWVRVNMSVVGQRLLNELRGVPAVAWEFEPPPKKNITNSRSFGYLLKSKKEIGEALANYAANVAEKLRTQKTHCRELTVFIQTNTHRIERPQYMRSVNLELPHASNSTADLIKYAIKGLDMIFQPGYEYMKAGIVASDLMTDKVVQQDLFEDALQQKNKKIMAAMDTVNNTMGKEMVRMAAQGFTRRYKLRADHLSSRYTTCKEEMLKVKMK